MQTILLVEDDQDVLKLIKTVLEDAGYKVLVALTS
jgi:DNA-binding response OmpR family regulator